jgi:DNA-binding GntR family transcriptional regulator
MINATQKAYNEILRRILSLELPPGTYISRNDLAEQLEISKTPIREALQLLEQDKLVKIFPQSKTLVTKINIDEIKRSNFFRVAVEIEVLREMIEKYDEKTLAKIERNLKKQEEISEDVTRLNEFDEIDK